VASLGALVALALTGCTWLYGPTVELPEDTAEAVEKPGIGARALLRANQVELELASWGPALHRNRLARCASIPRSRALRAAIRQPTQPSVSSIAWGRPSRRAGTRRPRVPCSTSASWLGNACCARRPASRDARTLEKFQKWSEGFDANAYSVERIELMQRIDRALLTSQTAVWLNRAMLDAGLRRSARARRRTPRSRFALRAHYAGEEPALYPLSAEQVLRWNLYAFAWLSDSDLERYAAFAESPSAQWWVVASARAYRVTLTGAGEELFQALRPRNTF
jgi:hypothetical protein